MSKMDGVLAVIVTIDPADAHVETLPSELLREPEQHFSLFACHCSLARAIRPDGPAFVAQSAPLAEKDKNAELPTFRLPS